MNLGTVFGGVEFESCVMNAAGVLCMTAEELDAVAASDAATFVTKTATLEARPGNPEPRYKDVGANSINSMGLPNQGLDYYLDYLSRDSQQASRFLSISPLHPDDVPQLFTRITASGFTGMVELNLSCPNIPGKPQIAYDFDDADRILALATELYAADGGRLGVKLPPFFDLAHFDAFAEILNKYPLTFINSVNSPGNGLMIDGLSMSIAPKQGFGGIGGPTIKPWALANVHAFYQRLKPEIQIIGTGGVATGRDVFEHILCGASLVQTGTTLHQQGPELFTRLLSELTVEMQKYCFESLDDFRGQVNYL